MPIGNALDVLETLRIVAIEGIANVLGTATLLLRIVRNFGCSFLASDRTVSRILSAHLQRAALLVPVPLPSRLVHGPRGPAARESCRFTDMMLIKMLMIVNVSLSRNDLSSITDLACCRLLELEMEKEDSKDWKRRIE